MVEGDLGLSFLDSGLLKFAILSAVLLFLGYHGVSLFVFSVIFVLSLYLLGVSVWIIILFIGLLVVCNVASFRKLLISKYVMELINKLKLMPEISETERVILEAGTTWVDGELFGGDPNFKNIMSQPYEGLSEEETSFLNHQCEQLCKIMDDEDAYKQGDLSKEVWNFLKKEKFFGLIIPKEYGGLGFSAKCHGEVISKLSSCSLPLTISVMVPNSLGPAELLAHYGTKEQKDHYLPRLASGQDIPCFALTEPHAGSDAGAIKASAVVFKGEGDELYLKLNWDKRWITLGAAASLIGLAVRLYDPDLLLGDKEDLGITCVLVDSKTSGVSNNKRHDPLGVPFINSPIYGKDVVVPINQIIGGIEGAGKGWQMLMESLSAGRSISLPSQSAGGCKLVAYVTGAYAQVRQQFGMPIGNFEGIDEGVARIGAFAYLLDAARVFTAGAVDGGIKPAVVSAIVKYSSTELTRKTLCDAMDIFGGAGISMGPRNLIAKGYIASPISITVEGANIVTRTLMIFGQGAIRCHPFAYREVISLQKKDLDNFDQAFMGHVGHVLKTSARFIVLSLTRGHVYQGYGNSVTKRHYQRLVWASAAFAFFTEIAMGTLGGKLKIKEKITGRFADVLSWMYLITAALRRFESEGAEKAHEPFINYIAEYGFKVISDSLVGICNNMDVPILGRLLRTVVSPLLSVNTISDGVSDSLGTKLAKVCMTPGALRDKIFGGIYIPESGSDHQMARLNEAFIKAHEAQAVFTKIKKAVHKGVLEKARAAELLDPAVEQGVISKEEAQLAKAAQAACDDAIQVDSFLVSEFKSGKLNI
jgi:acyl-CoA dehydrogenase